MEHRPTPSSSCCAGAPAAAMPPPVHGRFELVDHFGRPVDERSWDDCHLLVFFGFTHCAVVCPRELARLSAALALMGHEADRVQPLYVSVDPERDSPDCLRAYLETRAPRFVGLTGSAEAIEQTKRNFRVFATKRADADAPGGYVVPHTAFAYFLAPGGRFLAHFSDVVPEAELAASMLQQLGPLVP